MPRTKTPPAPPVSAPANAPERILEAARAEFVAKGFAGARMVGIAKRAGVNHALLHYYFGSKEKLYQEAVRDLIGAIWGPMKSELEAVPPDSSFEQLLSSLLKAHARALSARPDFLLFLIRNVHEAKGVPLGIAEVFESFGDVPRRIREALSKEIAAGRLRPIAPVHFWLNLGGMTISAFMASQMLKNVKDAPFMPPQFSEKFFLERAEVIASTLVRSLRPDSPTQEVA